MLMRFITQDTKHLTLNRYVVFRLKLVAKRIMYTNGQLLASKVAFYSLLGIDFQRET